MAGSARATALLDNSAAPTVVAITSFFFMETLFFRFSVVRKSEGLSWDGFMGSGQASPVTNRLQKNPTADGLKCNLQPTWSAMDVAVRLCTGQN